MIDDAAVRAELARRGLPFERYGDVAAELMGGPKATVPQAPSQAEINAARWMHYCMWVDSLKAKSAG